MKAELCELVSFGDRALDAIVAASAQVRFDPQQRYQLYAVTLHATILQLCGGALALAKTDFTAGIAMLLRSLYEGLVDLDNLVSDASYYERMDAANLVQALKLLRESPTNPLLAGLEQKHDVAKLTTELQAQLEVLKAKNKGVQHIIDRCVAVGRGHEYSTIYVNLCTDGHNNVTALIDRHVNFLQEPDALEVNLFGDGDQVAIARRVFWATGWMLDSARLIHGAFRTGYDGVGELQREHDALRSRIVE